MKKILTTVIILSILVAAGWYFLPALQKKFFPGSVEVRTRIDTVFVQVPAPVIVRTDTIVLTKRIINTDTVFVYLDTMETITKVGDTLIVPISTKEYRTDDYRAFVSGFRANLDSIYIYRRVDSVMTRKAPKIALSVGPGISLTTDGKVRPSINLNLGFVLYSK